jgi:hypothetical protein
MLIHRPMPIDAEPVKQTRKVVEESRKLLLEQPPPGHIRWPQDRKGFPAPG